MEDSNLKGINFDYHNPGSATQLSRAITDGNPERVMRLLSKGQNPNVPDNRGYTPLHAAACLPNDKGTVYVKPLLRFNAEINHKTHDGETALHLACKHRNSKFAQLLLRLGANGITKSLDNLDTPLHFAAEGGSKELILQLLKAGCDVNSPNMDGETPLFRAIAKCNIPGARVLMKNGASTDHRNDTGQTPLSVCCRINNLELFNTVLKYSQQDLGAHVDSFGSTLLHEALAANNESIVDRLLELGARTDVADNGGTLPLHTAILKANLHLAKKIIELTSKDAVVNYTLDHPGKGKSLMGLAAYRNEEMIFEAIKSKEFPPSILASPIFFHCQSEIELQEHVCGPVAYTALTKGHFPLTSSSIPLLVDAGVPLDPVYKYVDTPNIGCVEAAVRCHADHSREITCYCLDTIKFLLDSGGDPDFAPNGETPRPYILAAKNNFIDILGLLLQFSSKMDIDSLIDKLSVCSTITGNASKQWAYFLASYSDGKSMRSLPEPCWCVPSLRNICRGVIRQEVREKCGKSMNFKSLMFKSFPKPIATFLLYSDLYTST